MTAPRRNKFFAALLAKETYLAILVFIFLNTTVYLSGTSIDPQVRNAVLDELGTFPQTSGDSRSGNGVPDMVPAIADKLSFLGQLSGVGEWSASTSIDKDMERKPRDPLLLPSHLSQKLNLTQEPEYLGVLLDAGRHYFPLEWLYHLIDYLDLLGFNLIHFRLTDDQAFNIRLDSHPHLAQPASGSGGQVYTAQELRDLVKYAFSKNITIMPEINVPGHAGGFAGSIPNIVVPCLKFICDNGYGVPLNVSHPDLLPLLRDILSEVKDIFSTAPFFHLGGDELEMSKECFTELGVGMLNYSKFEEDLGKMLIEIGIDHDRVVRWEMTGQDKLQSVNTRIKGIDHYWLTRGYKSVENPPPFFCSQGLYFDTNNDEEAKRIYHRTRSMQQKKKPIAIIAGTFELGVDFWMQRNVAGRLLAVAMGASKEVYWAKGPKSFEAKYMDYCNGVGLPIEMCEKMGLPMIKTEHYKRNWKRTFQRWQHDICDRLSTQESVSWQMKCSSGLMHGQMKYSKVHYEKTNITEREARNGFTNMMKAKMLRPSRKLQLIPKHRVPYTGITLDLVQDKGYSSEGQKSIERFMDYLSSLGFNMLQLRVVSDFGMALQLHQKSLLSSYDQNHVYGIHHITMLTQYASSRGIHIMPELSVIHQAGGWAKAAPLVACAKQFCQEGGSFALDTSSDTILPTIGSTLRLLSKKLTSPFVHLGYDDREESSKCMQAAGVTPKYDQFEQKIKDVLEHEGIPLDKVLRWDNQEQVNYGTRAGNMTHYRVGMPSSSDTNFFLSTGLNLDDPMSNLETAWDIFIYVRKVIAYNPEGIIAPVNVFQENILVALNVYQRLLAVAIGLSSIDLDEVSFSKIFHELCEESSMNSNCSQFGKVFDPEKAANLIRAEEAANRKQTCSNHVFSLTKAFPREGVLVENGTDIHARGIVLDHPKYRNQHRYHAIDKLCQHPGALTPATK